MIHLIDCPEGHKALLAYSGATQVITCGFDKDCWTMLAINETGKRTLQEKWNWGPPTNTKFEIITFDKFYYIMHKEDNFCWTGPKADSIDKAIIRYRNGVSLWGVHNNV